MISEHDADATAHYRSTRRDLLDLLARQPADHLDLPVPACPDWRVRDVVAHLVGIAADLNAGRIPGPDDDGDAWTARQVEARAGATLAELAEEWERESGPFEAGLDLFGYAMGSHFLGDLLQHASDIRAALDLERVADDLTLDIAFDFYADAAHESLVADADGAVTMVLGQERLTIGPDVAVAELTTDRFEAFRLLGGRRSEAQIRALPWTGDVDRVVRRLSRYPLPVTDLVDP